MEFANDLLGSHRSRVEPWADGAASGAIAWTELHARFSAAHGAARELAWAESVRPVRLGGFRNWAKVGLAQNKTSLRINPTDLADGKPAAGIEDKVAQNPLLVVEDNDD